MGRLVEYQVKPCTVNLLPWFCVDLLVLCYLIWLFSTCCFDIGAAKEVLTNMMSLVKVLAVATILMVLVISSDAYAMRGFSLADNSLEQEPNYDYLARYIMTTKKRSCIRRGGTCDHRPSDCCFNSTCRCNLWRTNCRCQRMGLFQKWGK